MQIPMVLNSPEFTLAVNMLNKLTREPRDYELHELYGLYQQATIGNINSIEPETNDPYWIAWNKYKDLNTYDSEVKYITFVNTLIDKYGFDSNKT